MDLVDAHAMHARGVGGPTILFGHGLGGGQDQWTEVAGRLAPTHRVVTFSLAGSPGADPRLYHGDRHDSILGFADDLARLCAEAGLRGAVYVGHSMSGMAGALAAAADPGLFRAVVLIGASARYVDDPRDGYQGGFSQAAVDSLLEAIASDFALWSAGFAPAVMGEQDRPEYVTDFTRSLASYDPVMAYALFRAAFTSDFRAVMPRVPVPTLLLSTPADPAVPVAAAQWLANAIPQGRLELIDAVGHFPHVVAAPAVAERIDRFVAGLVV